MSEQFDYLKKVIDGIDKDFIEESADSMLESKSEIKTHDFNDEDLIVVNAKPKNKLGNKAVGLAAAAAVLVCAVSASAFMLTRGEDISVVQSGSSVVSGINSTVDKESVTDSYLVDAEFVSLSDLYAKADEALLKKYDKLSLPQSITLDKAEQLYTFTADWSIEGDAEKIKNDIAGFGNVIVGTKINQSEIQFDEENSEYLWESGTKHISCSPDLNGGYNLVFKDEEYTSIKVDYTYEKIVRFDRGETAESEYTLGGELYSVKDATEFCNKTLEKLEQFIHPAEDLRLKTLLIKKLDNGEYTYRCIVEKLINGIPLDEGCDYANIKTGISKPTYVVLEMDAPAHFNQITMFYSNSYVLDSETGNINMQECSDSFISLSSACDILSKNIGTHFGVRDIDIKYIAIIGNYGDVVPSATQYRPMWTFVLDEKLTHNASPNDDTRMCAYVDMQNGAVYIVDNISHAVYFELKPSYSLMNEELEKSPVDIFDKEITEVKQLVNSYPNLKADENMFVNAPEKSTVYSYIGRYPTPEQMPQNFEKFFEEYKAYFKAFFPDREMKDEYMFFYTVLENGRMSDLMLVSEHYDDLVAGKYTVIYPEYREDINKPNTSAGRVAFTSPWAIGYGGLSMNKGKTIEQAGPTIWVSDDYGNPKRAYPSLIDYQADAYFRHVGTYSPESEVSFNLLDGKASIKECVDYYEDFVNNKLPAPEKANATTVVTSVDVLQINDELYCYSFQVAPMLDNVIAETKPSDYNDFTLHYSYDLLNTSALMIESNDVDYMNGYYRIESIEEGNVKTLTDIISFEAALKTVSDKMGDTTSFEVEKIEFLYRRKYILTEDGYIDAHNGMPYEAIPAWKFTLYDSKADKYFASYVYAESGEFDYFTYTD